jgi:hypothetical protein
MFARSICDVCIKKEEDAFETVKKYIDENPNNTAAQIAADTQVSVRLIQQFLKEGRLEPSAGMSDVALKCAQCGAAIKKGLFCSKCSSDISDEFNKKSTHAAAPSPVKKTARMYTAERR